MMIPEIDAPSNVKDFRAISIINIVPKIISKLLATRIAKFMSELVSINKIVFVKGRQISENFVATREILPHISKGKWMAVFFKICFAKAFDSINWNFFVQSATD